MNKQEVNIYIDNIFKSLREKNIDKLIPYISPKLAGLLENRDLEFLSGWIEDDEEQILFDRLASELLDVIPEEYKEFAYERLYFEDPVIIPTEVLNRKKDEINQKSDEEKIEIIKKYYRLNSMKCIEFAKSIVSDELKLSIHNYFSKHLTLEIFKTLTDAGKIKVLDKLKKDSNKLEIIKTIEDDNNKIETISKVEELETKLKIVEFLRDIKKRKVAIDIIAEDDGKKIELIEKINDDFFKLMVAVAIENDDKKIQVIECLEQEYDKVEVAKTINDDDKKLRFIKNISQDTYKAVIATTLTDDSKKLEAIDFISHEFYKSVVAKMIKDYSKKIIVISKLNSDIMRFLIVKELTEEDKKIDVIDFFTEDRYRVSVASTIGEKNILLVSEKIADKEEFLEKCIYRNSNISDLFIIEHLKDLMQLLGVPSEEIDYKIPALIRMYEKNNSIIRSVNYKILDAKYIEKFGEDKINLISCYYNIQKEILKLTDRKLDILNSCIEYYSRNTQTEEWTNFAEKIIQTLNTEQYDELIDSVDIDDEEIIKKLCFLLQANNRFNIKSKEELENYKNIKSRQTEQWIKSNLIEDKQNAVLEKIFGHDKEFAIRILETYGEDRRFIGDSEWRYYLEALNKILDCDTAEILEKVYQEVQEIEYNDQSLIERKLKNEYGKLYNEGLFETKEENKIEEGVYYAGTDFKMIITSIGAFCKNDEIPNYKEDWNRPTIASQHFCTSYIRNDMLGTAPIKNICYGFTNMKEDSLMISANQDVYSSADKDFVSKAWKKEKYYAPDNQINNTIFYNEMDFRRIQGGQKKQPSYIVVFKRNGIVNNMEEAKKAQKDWDGIPIVVIDVDECLKSEEKNLNEMIAKYKKTRDNKLKKQIYYKLRNNRNTSCEFCKDINIKEFESRNRIDEDELAINYDICNSQDRNEEVGRMRVLFRRIKEVEQEVEY